MMAITELERVIGAESISLMKRREVSGQIEMSPLGSDL